MKLFTYRGKRVHAFHRKLKGITWLIWWFPFLLAISYYSYLHIEELKVHPLPQGYFLGAGLLFSLILSWFINRVCYRKLLFFKSSTAFEFFLAFC